MSALTDIPAPSHPGRAPAPPKAGGTAADAARADYIDIDKPGFWPVCFALLLSGFCAFSSLYCMQPLLPIFGTEFGISPAAASLSLTATTVALAIGLVFAGPISDTVGRKPMILFSVVATGVLMIATTLAPNWHALLMMRALMGFLLGGVTAINLTYLAEEVAPHCLGRAVGLVLAGNSIGSMIARIAVGVAADHMDWRWPVAAIGVLALVSALLLWFWLPASRHFRPARFSLAATLGNYALHLRTPGLGAAFLAAFLLMGCFIAFFNYIGFRLLADPFDMGQMVVGLISLVFLPSTYAAVGAGRLGDRFGARPVYLGAVAVMLTGLALTALPWIATLGLGTLIFTFGFFAAHSTAAGYVGRTARTARAQATSMYQIAFYAGASIAGTIAGLFWQGLGWNGIVLLLGAMLVIAGLNGRSLQPARS